MKKAVNPTKKHSMKCPRLYGQDCSCDGFHTFEELYDHRIALYIALCRSLVNKSPEHTNGGIWRSKRHSDGELCFGTGTQFVLGIRTDPSHQITYHIPIERWRETSFAYTLKKAPTWDGHSSDDVIKRLKKLPAPTPTTL